MRRLALLTTLVLPLIACASDKPPATEGGPAKTDSGAHEVGAEAGAEAEAGEAEAGGPEEAGGTACQTDADCVPAECCHPASCVLASAAPNCSDTMCTEECRGGTMDCGQGHCACQSGTCAAVMDKPLE
jgi:hypothetical protein